MSANQAQLNSTEQPFTVEKQGFDYTILSPETRIVIQQNANEIKSLMRRTAQDIINIGQKLLEVKEQLGHGHFEAWLRVEFNWGSWTARKFMQVSRQFKSVNFTDLSIDASALYLLAAPSTPETVRQQALKCARQGETITHAKVKAIANQYDKLAKSKASKLFAVDIPAQTYPLAQTVNPENAVVLKKSEDKLLGKETATSAESNDDLPKEEVKIIDAGSLFRVSRLVCIMDFAQKDHKWLGEVVEVKEATSTNIEVVIKISLQLSKVEE